MPRKCKPITYSQVGDNYTTKDPIKILAQKAARQTAGNLQKFGFQEISGSRGESAFVWSFRTDFYLASVIEGLGTKNLVADEMRKIVDPERSRRTYYDIVGHDTVASIINDLVSVGAKPLVVNAYWAIENNSWLQDEKRTKDLIRGWRDACKLAGATWGGGETPTLKGIIRPKTIDLGGAAVGVIRPQTRLLTDKKLKIGDAILLLQSSGVNVNGLSLARAVAKRLSKGYATKLSSGKIYGEALLTKTNIYAKLIQDLLNGGVDIHYISNITGHGLRKIMRARQKYTYVIEKIFEPQEVFLFIQKQANLSDYEMYQTFNMGQDYAIFLPKEAVKKAMNIIKRNKLKAIDAGYVKKGKRQVIIKPKNLVYKGETLDIRV